MGRLIDATHRNLARLAVGAGFVMAASCALADSGLNAIRGVPLPQDLNRMNGPQLYDAYCASCHHAQGPRSGGVPFRGTSLSNTNNLVTVILQGRHRPPADVRMPGFAKELSDRQIATLSNYLTQRWGNPKATVSVKQVKALRRGAPGSGAR